MSNPNPAILAIALFLGLPAAAAENPGIELTDCQLAPVRGAARLPARCGSLSVPEDPADPDGPRIELQLAVVPALARTPEPDPVVFISGGPGQSALETFPSVRGAFGQIRRERDLILVDQRGTGGSNRLDCPEVSQDGEPGDEILPLIEACLDELPGDPRYYTTSAAVEDLELVREALGVETWNLYGISYGSRVAQHYLRQHPARTRAVILDGVVPPTLPLGPDISLDAQAALDLVFERCAADEACAAAFPDLPGTFDSLLARLTEEPREVSFDHPITAEYTTVTLDETGLGGAVRLLSYAPETVSLLPLLIHTAEISGDMRPLAAQAQMVTTDLAMQMAFGMHNAVVCTEDAPYYEDLETLRSRTEDAYLGSLQLDLLVDMCETWPAGRIDEGFNDLLVSDTPVLLLSGEADPVTPPSNAELAAEGLSRSLHLVGRGQGHGIAGRGCMPTVMADFLGRAGDPQFLTPSDPEAFDTACMDRMRPSPFFTSFTGWEP